MSELANRIPALFGSCVFNEETMEQYIQSSAMDAWRSCLQEGKALSLAVANDITPEPIAMDESLNLLSGGQTRALMIADIALICDSPIVLVDEIENAGIDKQRALSLLQSREKLVLVVTHDPHTALMAERRLVMSGGAVKAVITRSEREAALYDQLSIEYARSQRLQTLLRKGELLA